MTLSECSRRSAAAPPSVASVRIAELEAGSTGHRPPSPQSETAPRCRMLDRPDGHRRPLLQAWDASAQGAGHHHCDPGAQTRRDPGHSGRFFSVSPVNRAVGSRPPGRLGRAPRSAGNAAAVRARQVAYRRAVRAAMPRSERRPRACRRGSAPAPGGRGADPRAADHESSSWLRRRDYNRPTTAPLMQVAMVPERIDLRPSATISCRRSGTIVPMPPIRMPRLPKLANPQSA
jgi:hypothetical protein